MNLNHFTGTQQWHRYNPILFRNVLLTDGAKYVADEAGAYWLMDAIASHQPEARQNPNLREFQLWRLKVAPDKTAILECLEDSDKLPTIIQTIELTDFPLGELKLYVCPADHVNQVIMLPSEY
jgi:hypothetical protein